jgi:hypothetical protein
MSESNIIELRELLSREVQASAELSRRLEEKDITQFDGDPHWDRAMEAMGELELCAHRKL